MGLPLLRQYHTIGSIVTKRMVLNHSAFLYDPLGLATPVSLSSKLLLRDLWSAGLEWDEPLPPPLTARWSLIAGQLASLTSPTFQFQRCIGPTSTTSDIQLHIFTDASKQAYATAVYLRTVDRETLTVQSNLVCSKNRLAPVPKSTSKSASISSLAWS